ncbi:Phytepsin [Hordeum vulgare]|nr:Phytepsin [Hordeum vulgare]
MGTRGLALALLAAALLLQTLLPAVSEAEGLVRITLKKRPIDQNSRVTTGLSHSEEQLLLTGINTLGSKEEGDIVSLKNYMNVQYFGRSASARYRRRKPAAIQYDTGSIAGYFSEDSVTVGDLVVKDQEFIEATKERGVTFLVAMFDCILGLGFKEISVGKAVPVCDITILSLVAARTLAFSSSYVQTIAYMLGCQHPKYFPDEEEALKVP